MVAKGLHNSFKIVEEETVRMGNCKWNISKYNLELVFVEKCKISVGQGKIRLVLNEIGAARDWQNVDAVLKDQE